MYNLISNEIYKILHMKWVKVLILVSLLVSLLNTQSVNIFVNTLFNNQETKQQTFEEIYQKDKEERLKMEEEYFLKEGAEKIYTHEERVERGKGSPVNGREKLIVLIANNENLVLCIGILIGLFVAAEFTHTPLGLNVAYGHNRKKVFLAKMLAAWLTGLIICWGYIFLQVGIDTLLIGWGKPFDAAELQYVCRMIGLAALNYLLFINVCITFSVLLKRTGITIACCVGAGLIVSLLIAIGKYYIPYWEVIMQYLPIDKGEIMVRYQLSKGQIIAEVLQIMTANVLLYFVNQRLFSRAEL